MNSSSPLRLDNNEITTFNNGTSLNNNNTLNIPQKEDDAFIMLIVSFGDGKGE